MNNNVNVINKAEKDLCVTVSNDVDGKIQIIIDVKKDNIDLLSLKAGEVFNVGDIEYIVLEQLANQKTAVIKKELLEDTMKFGSNNNNWKKSSIRELLNKEYLEKIEKAFGSDRIVEHTVDLLSLDGLNDYGISTDKVSLLTIDQYRKYRKVLGANLNKSWWLVTPDSTLLGSSASYVLYVNSDGDVYYDVCYWSAKGVRPFFIIQS